MSDDNNRHPSDGLVPDPDKVADVKGLDDETPDAFGEPMGEDILENELPEEGVTPEDVVFEEDLERDLQQGATEGRDVSDTDADGKSPGSEYAGHDTDYEQEVEDEEIERYREGGA